MSKEEKNFLTKVKKVIAFEGKKKTEDEKLRKRMIDFITNFQSMIPERYNQCELLDYLLDDDIDHLFSISNRTDGKSFNYIDFFIEFSYEFGIGFFLIARHYTLRQAYVDFIEKIYTKKDNLNLEDFSVRRTDHYIICYHKNKVVGIVSDLNTATDLKYHSNFLEDFPIIIYDEFLAIMSDYLPDEYTRLKTIYSSVDRTGTIDGIHIPKIFYLGNAVNFDSPLLSAFNLFNKLEKHPINHLRTYGNIALEMRKNEHANGDRNLRAFDDADDAMSTGQFEINHFNIADEKQRLLFEMNSETFFIKIPEKYLKVTYDKDTYKSLLSVVDFADTYAYNMMVQDNKPESIFLKSSYYSDRQAVKYQKNLYLFDNAFSKNYITSRLELASIKIQKCISIYDSTHAPTPYEVKKEQQYTDMYLRETKKGLFKRFTNN